MLHLSYDREFPPPVPAYASLSYSHLEDYLPVTILSLLDMRDSPHLTLKIEQIIIFGRHGSLFSSGPFGVSISNAIVLAHQRGMCYLSSIPFVCYHSIVTMWRQGGTRWDLSSVYTITWHFWYMHRSNDG